MMEIIRLNYDMPAQLDNTCVALGFFDGVHLAHQVLLEKCLNIAEDHDWHSAVMTFSTHVLAHIQNTPFYHLTSLSDKARIFSDMGFDRLYVLNVSDGLIDLEPEMFVTRFLSRAKHVVAGFDFSYGAKGKGKVDDLKHKPFGLTVVNKITKNMKKIGSKRIRDALREGNIRLANVLLGRSFTIHGKVISGRKRGRHLGYPTANIDYDGYILPKKGVYHTQSFFNDRKYDSLTNIGHNPTFDDEGIMLETHVMEFDGDLYDKHMTVQFERYIRKEKRFKSKEALIRQIDRDKEQIVSRNKQNQDTEDKL